LGDPNHDQHAAYPQPDRQRPFRRPPARGADEIASFIFGERGSRRKVYYLAECARLPVFRLGTLLCARRSVLMNWIAGQESKALPPA